MNNATRYGDARNLTRPHQEGEERLEHETRLNGPGFALVLETRKISHDPQTGRFYVTEVWRPE